MYAYKDQFTSQTKVRGEKKRERERERENVDKMFKYSRLPYFWQAAIIWQVYG